MAQQSVSPARARSKAPPVDLSELADLRRQLTSYVEAIEVGELEASAYVHGCFRGALAIVEGVLSTGKMRHSHT
jgi:hypothetical protein